MRREEDRANKRINDLQRRQKFVQEMHNEKALRMQTKDTFRKTMHDTENANRDQFNRERVYSQSRIMSNMERTFQGNRNTYLELKNQQRRINDQVLGNRDNFLKEKQRAFQNVKEQAKRAKSNFNHMNQSNLMNLNQSYMNRVKDRHDDAFRTEQAAKKLEQEEAQLLNRLQKTYQTERNMVEQLNKVNDMSPIKAKKGQASAGAATPQIEKKN